MIISDAKIYTHGGFREDLEIEINGDVIARVGTAGSLSGERLSFGGAYVCPGLIDIHIHGISGSETMDGYDGIRHMAEVLPRYGVTAFLPTTTPDTPARTREVIKDASRVKGGAAIPGVHLEGPFVNPNNKGALDENALCLPSEEMFDEMTDGCRGFVRMMTMAPELEGAMSLAEKLSREGIRLAVGHTSAAAEITGEALRRGFSGATHLFNAMPPVHHRAPGAAIKALVEDGCTVQLIADFLHVHRDMLRLAYRCRGGDIALITDSMAAAALGDGEYMLGTKAVTVKDGAARLPEGNLAGSTLTLDSGVMNFASVTGDFHAAIMAASETPASYIGESLRGKLETGCIADFTVWRGGKLEETYIGGKRITR